MVILKSLWIRTRKSTKDIYNEIYHSNAKLIKDGLHTHKNHLKESQCLKKEKIEDRINSYQAIYKYKVIESKFK